ncbi:MULTISPECIES: FUSC family protein [unclassified Lentimicrobium]|uniref:FUSC family protein n=1 Tax=unclassified Lentimicrobium TaxID=2677434 RepID=UPI001555F957|nr:MULTISPECIES: FUSC family protein [unclassified Lentimicrobium]NPD43973.1 FUSC family protein [Lentimicrobium sp. S6]NPD84113.1 FUSC family protein [Lentimicrobium sp. L6]
MEQKDLHSLSDEELKAEAKKMKSTATINAFIIGFLAGIIVYSVVYSTWGLVTLVPLFIIYKLVNKPNQDKELKALLKERGMK